MDAGDLARPRDPLPELPEYLIRAKRMAPQSKRNEARQFLERELDWIHMNPKARATNKSRLKNYDKMMEEVEQADDSSSCRSRPASASATRSFALRRSTSRRRREGRA